MPDSKVKESGQIFLACTISRLDLSSTEVESRTVTDVSSLHTIGLGPTAWISMGLLIYNKLSSNDRFNSAA